MKKIVPGRIPYGYDLYTSWVALQQQRPQLYVAAVFENAGKVLLRQDGDELSLPTIFHNATDPGLLNALQRLLKGLQILGLPQGVKLLGVCEPEQECLVESPWYVLIKVPARGIVAPPGFFWFDPALLAQSQKITELVLASLAVLAACSKVAAVPPAVVVEPVADLPLVKITARTRRKVSSGVAATAAT